MKALTKRQREAAEKRLAKSGLENAKAFQMSRKAFAKRLAKLQPTASKCPVCQCYFDAVINGKGECGNCNR